MGPNTGSTRATLLAVVGLCLAEVACQQPVVGDRAAVANPTEGPTIAIEDGWIDLHGHAVVTFTVNQDAVPLVLAEVIALRPRFTLAKLTDHPADGLRAWESLVPTGANVAPVLPPGGPDDPTVLTTVRQPGYEEASSLVDLDGGRYRYVFSTSVTAFNPEETLRLGAWLAHAEAPSLRTATTYDFRPSGGPVEARDTVLDKNCNTCHVNLVVHESIAGVRLCLTCHTWQNVDPLTVDPAALVTTGVGPKTNPNPLELGRLLHRVHRGKDLPTVYQTAWNGTAPTTVPSAVALPGPFVQQKPGAPARSPLPGRKFSVFNEAGREVVFARAIQLAATDPSLPNTQLLVEGGLFPRDLRDCAVCHADAAQGWLVRYGVSRRTCSGCHPEVWFRASSPAADRVRFPHPGGPQADDSGCLGCHVDGSIKPYAPLDEVHVVPARAPRYNKPVAQIVRVEDLAPGKQPKVTFRLWDRAGPIAPSPGAPVPAYEPDSAYSSVVARRFAANAVLIKIQGPTVPDYSSLTGVNLQSAVGNPDPTLLSTSSGTDEYVYTFSSTVPPGAVGTFIVGMEARRFAAPAHYDPARDAFRWPYTGETVSETIENTWVFVNSASGTWPPPPGSPPPVPRRKVVATEKCLVCHDRIEFHSGNRHDPNWCITCHAPDLTDIDKRINVHGRLYPGGPVNVGATHDGVEERSTHFKTMMHRIHTGSRKGSASLEGIKPYALYFSKAYFFDRGGYPGDLRNCTLCHEGKTYLLENLPADAPPTRGNEDSTIWHPTGALAHDPAEPAMLPMRAACTGCHANGATFAHVAAKTVGGVETCTQCHEKGALSVEAAHGLVAATGGGASARFSSIVSTILSPRCASTACHAAGATPPRLDAAGAYDALVDVPSGQSSLLQVKPGAPEASYLVYKLRGTAASVGGSVATRMPTDGALAPADIAAIEAWIANGAPND